MGAGVLLAIGILTKIFPGVLVFGALVAFDWRGLLRLLIGAVLTLLVCLVPLARIGPGMLGASFQNMQTRAPWETVPALVQGNYYNGGLPLPTDRTTVPPAAPRGREVLPGMVIFLPEAVLMLLTTACALWLVRRQPNRTAHDVVVVITMGLASFLLTNKGFSPQFLAWLAPFLLLVWPDRVGLLYTVAFTLFFIAYYTLIAPSMSAHARGNLPDQQIATVLWTAILIRSALLTIVIGHLGVLVWRRTRGAARARRRLPAVSPPATPEFSG
jgi:hypothetical protein